MREFRIGLFLGLRQIQRANIWATILTIVIVLFTFLNLVTLNGILIGILDGASREVKEQSLADVILSPIGDETRIKETYRLTEELDNYHEISSFSTRYSGLALIEANYSVRRDMTQDPDVIAVNVVGINVADENETTNLSDMVGEGEFLDDNESGFLLMGKYSVDRYAEEFGDVFDSLRDVYPGTKVMVTAGEQSREFTVKGIVDSKVDLVSVGVYMTELDFRRLFDRVDQNANQIAIKLQSSYTEEQVRDRLRASELSELAEINTFEEEIPKFVTDVRETFTLLGLIVGVIGICVASITIFIIIFINALSRRQQIGILKAVGITRRTIEYAYITQAFVYAVVGSFLGIVITYFILTPYFLENPIDFPFSDVSLSVDNTGMLIRAIVLTGVACIAGFVPVWMIAKKNTLDSILGRK